MKLSERTIIKSVLSLICVSFMVMMTSGEESKNQIANVTDTISNVPALNSSVDSDRQVLLETTTNYTNASLTTSDKLHSGVSARVFGDKRSIHTLLHSVKRSIKKTLFAWTYYGPEFGLCGCLFKFAWFEYPIVPEMTYAAMGRARRMVSGFMADFMEGWREDRRKDLYSVNYKPLEPPVDDYLNYESGYITDDYSPNRRFAEVIQRSPVKVPVPQKIDPKLSGVIDMLITLQPKNKSEVARADKLPVGVELQKIMDHNIPASNSSNQKFSTQYSTGNSLNEWGNQKVTRQSRQLPTHFIPPPQSPPQIILATPAQQMTRVVLPSPVQPVPQVNSSPSRRIFDQKHLPKYQDLPPADYSYVKNGVHHHIHDLRKNKTPLRYNDLHNDVGVRSGGIEDTILSLFGLSHPKRSIAKCSKIYIFQVILRFIQQLFVH